MDPVIVTKGASQEYTHKALLSSHVTSPFATTTLGNWQESDSMKDICSSFENGKIESLQLSVNGADRNRASSRLLTMQEKCGDKKSWDIRENIQWKVQSEGGEGMAPWREGKGKVGFHHSVR